MSQYSDFLQKKLDQAQYTKLEALGSKAILDFVGECVKLCNPASVFVRTDNDQDRAFIREQAVKQGEEVSLATSGHTCHFDGVRDQARDKKNTKYLFPAESKQGYYLNSTEREQGLTEINGLLSGIMEGKQMFVCVFCLGPVNSPFSLLAVQITDSAYVAHSEDILYRPGYEMLKKSKADSFFKFVHSAGALEGAVSKNIDKRRVYIDLEDKKVFSVNTQYAGNTVGLKKLSLRLAIQEASRSDWLAEHMFVMGVTSGDEKVYFCGAYPSMCGKTSTAMILGESIVGDDIAYLRNIDGQVRAVNVERGIFGIIKDVNAENDPLPFKVLTNEGEVIFSNILIGKNGVPYWIGKDIALPHEGVNFAGPWHPGKTDAQGVEITPSHKNARYTIRLSVLDNVDENLENPQGVVTQGLIYGGRDSDTSCPVEESFSWQHGVVIKGASLESETTAATLGKEGVRVFNPMSNIDFLPILLGTYLKMHLDFGARLKKPPVIFSSNYFLRGKEGKFLNAMRDKRVWLKWMALRIKGEAGALQTPIGYIPKYQDLRGLFKECFDAPYLEDSYVNQFTLRIPQNVAKIERIRNIYNDLQEIPPVVFEELEAQEKRLQACQKTCGDYVSPFVFKEVQ